MIAVAPTVTGWPSPAPAVGAAPVPAVGAALAAVVGAALAVLLAGALAAVLAGVAAAGGTLGAGGALEHAASSDATLAEMPSSTAWRRLTRSGVDMAIEVPPDLNHRSYMICEAQNVLQLRDVHVLWLWAPKRTTGSGFARAT